MSTGNSNTAVGANALRQADGTEGVNTAIGISSMENIDYDGSSYNTAVGVSSLRGGSLSNPVTYNVAIGYNSLYAITAGDSNTAVGPLT